MMDRSNFVLCGLGGQGILFMTKVLSETALDEGYDIMGAETHGMAQRGGSVVSHLRLGDVQGSLVRNGSAHFLLSLDEVEGYRNIPFLAKGARMYINADPAKAFREEVKGYLAQKRIIGHSVPASAMARDAGVPMATNLALLGYFAAFGVGPLPQEAIKSTIEKISPASFRENNLKIFTAGLERGLEEKGH